MENGGVLGAKDGRSGAEVEVEAAHAGQMSRAIIGRRLRITLIMVKKSAGINGLMGINKPICES